MGASARVPTRSRRRPVTPGHVWSAQRPHGLPPRATRMSRLPSATRAPRRLVAAGMDHIGEPPSRMRTHVECLSRLRSGVTADVARTRIGLEAAFLSSRGGAVRGSGRPPVDVRRRCAHNHHLDCVVRVSHKNHHGRPGAPTRGVSVWRVPRSRRGAAVRGRERRVRLGHDRQLHEAGGAFVGHPSPLSSQTGLSPRGSCFRSMFRRGAQHLVRSVPRVVEQRCVPTN